MPSTPMRLIPDFDYGSRTGAYCFVYLDGGGSGLALA
jgi:hypothetical protein